MQQWQQAAPLPHQLEPQYLKTGQPSQLQSLWAVQQGSEEATVLLQLWAQISSMQAMLTSQAPRSVRLQTLPMMVVQAVKQQLHNSLVKLLCLVHPAHSPQSSRCQLSSSSSR